MEDRIQKIKSMNDMHDLEHNAYISFSGGKDSTVLSKLVDLALPGNKIPRVYIDTGIDYRAIRDFVVDFGKADNRLEIIRPTKNIRAMLETFGYPFKSKEHSQKVALFQKSGETKTVLNYIGKGTKRNFLCPSILKYNFSKDFNLKVSDKCCYELKKHPAEKWAGENGRPISMTGIRQDEGGLRKSVASCAVFYDEGKTQLHKFHPLLVVSNDWVDEFVKVYRLELCKLYYPPFNFKRTGCKGCPYSVDLERQLEVMEELLPNERKQCEMIWEPVYSEYRRIGYRLSNPDDFLF